MSWNLPFWTKKIRPGLFCFFVYITMSMSFVLPCVSLLQPCIFFSTSEALLINLPF